MAPAATSTIIMVMVMDMDPIPDASVAKAGINDSMTSASTRMCTDCTTAARRSCWPPDPRMTTTSRANTAEIPFYAFIFFREILNKIFFLY